MPLGRRRGAYYEGFVRQSQGDCGKSLVHVAKLDKQLASPAGKITVIAESIVGTIRNVPVGGPGVKAAAEAAGSAIVTRIAVEHTIVVVVVYVFRTQAEAERQVFADADVALYLRSQTGAADPEVIVQAFRSGFDQETGTVRRPELGLRQGYVAPLHVDAGDTGMSICSDRNRTNHTCADVAVFLERLTGEKMLQEPGPVSTGERIAVMCSWPLPRLIQTPATRVMS